jgi:hypothetical protein
MDEYEREKEDALFAEATFSFGFAVSEGAREVGRMNPDRAWILTPFDSWEKNPFYVGPPVKHPEDDSE